MKIKKCIWINISEANFVRLHTEAARDNISIGDLVHEYILLGLKWTRRAELQEQLERDNEQGRKELEAVQASLDEIYLQKKRDERNRKQRAYRLKVKKLKRQGRKLPRDPEADNEPDTAEVSQGPGITN